MLNKVALLFAFLFVSLLNAQNYNPIINYRFDGTPVNGIKIKTNIPFQDSQGMPTLTIEGYEYGNGRTIGLSLVWYVFSGNFINYSASSFGDYVPQIQLSNEGGKVVIFINHKGYYNRFTVRGYENLNSNSTWFQGWSIVDEIITGSNTVSVPYKNSFAGDVNMPGTGIWNGSGNVGIGSTTPTAKLFVKGIGNYTNTLSLQSPNAIQNLDFLAGYKLTGSPTGVREDLTMTLRSSGNSVGNIAFASGNDEIARISNNGNFGIGTTNPQAKLDVNGSLNTVGTIFNKGGIAMDFDNVDLTIYKDNDVLDWTTFRANKGKGLAFIGQPDYPAMVVSRINNNIGIGTTTPQTKLDVSGQVLAGFASSTTGVNAFSIRYENNGGNIVNWGSLRSSGAPFMGFGVKASSTTAHGFESANSDYPMERSALVLGGDIPGTAFQLLTAPNQQTTNGSSIQMTQVFKITNTGNAALKGKLEVKELKVTNTPTADFVFEEDYNLPKLEEVEKHIKEKKHLPEIASAKEMEKEGVNVGDFQIKLLQKIEELTLYVIDQNKKITDLEKELKELKSKK